MFRWHRLRTADDFVENDQMVGLATTGFEAGFDIAQAVSTSELRDCHASILVLAFEAFLSVAVVALYATSEGVYRQMIYRLFENEFARVHRLIAPTRKSGLKRDTSLGTGLSRCQVIKAYYYFVDSKL